MKILLVYGGLRFGGITVDVRNLEGGLAEARSQMRRDDVLAVEMLPPPLGAADICVWEDARDLALAEWSDAHSLAGVLA